MNCPRESCTGKSFPLIIRKSYDDRFAIGSCKYCDRNFILKDGKFCPRKEYWMRGGKHIERICYAEI